MASVSATVNVGTGASSSSSSSTSSTSGLLVSTNTIPNGTGTRENDRLIENHLAGTTGKDEQKVIPGHPGEIVLSIHAETMRLIGYALFWLMIFISIFVSKIAVDPTLLTNNLLITMFGFNNICVYFDFEPARGVAAMFWIFAEYTLVTYCLLNTLSFYFLYKTRIAQNAEMRVEPWMMVVVWIFLPIQCLLVALFRMVYVEDPAQQGMVPHYLGFLGLQWALLFICLQNHWYSYIERRTWLTLPKCLTVGYIVALFTLTIVKQAWGLGAMTGHPLWCSAGPDCTAGAKVAQAIDYGWMVLAAFLPMIFAWQARRTSPALVFKISMPNAIFTAVPKE